MTLATPFQGLLTKYFLWDVKGKLYSKFGEDRSRTELTMLTVIFVWTDTGRTDGWTDGRTDAKVVLYSSNAVHCIGQTMKKFSFPPSILPVVQMGKMMIVLML